MKPDFVRTSNIVIAMLHKTKLRLLFFRTNREHVNLISTITNQDKKRFMIDDIALNATTMIKSLKRLIKDSGKFEAVS